MKIRLSAFIPLALLLAIGAAFAVGLARDPRLMPSALIDRAMPDFVLEPVFAGTPALAPADFIGQVSILNIFGSWCAACVVEHPTWMRLARDKQITLYGIVWRDTAQNGADWLHQYGNPYGKVGLDAHSKLAIDLGVTGAPETFIIDAKGRIRFKYIGPVSDQIWHEKFAPIIRAIQVPS